MSQTKICATLVCCVLALATVSVGQNQPPAPPAREPAKAPASAPAKAPASATNNTFLTKAIEVNSAEVELGKLASKKAQNARVKSYAAMLVKDHSAALAKLQKMQPGKVTLSSEHASLKTKLSGLSGAEFDRQYIDAMVNGHREAVSMFEEQIKTNSPADVTSAARDLLPTIKSHLEQGEQIQKTLGQPVKQG